MLFTRCTSSVISSNIDLHIQDHKIIIVNTFKLLGVLIDRELNFSNHTLHICKLVNRKCAIISQNKSLFSPKFKEILFKSLIISHFEYCSTLFISINQTSMNKLEKCFSKSIKQILNLRLSGLNICQQLSLLKPFKILPFQMRLFRHFCFFLHSLIRNGKAKSLIFKTGRKYERNIKLRNNYDVPGFNLLIRKFTFSRVAPKILNSFLDSLLNLSKNSLTSFFDSNMLNLFDKHFYSFFR